MVSYKKSASLPSTFSISYAVSVNSVDDDDYDILRSVENKIFNYIYVCSRNCEEFELQIGVLIFNTWHKQITNYQLLMNYSESR